MKFRFWTSYTGARGGTRGASVDPGSSVHTRGWDAGVRVTPRPRERDEFDVTMTYGSHDGGQDVHLGTVRDTRGGPRWIPADLPASEACGYIAVRKFTSGKVLGSRVMTRAEADREVSVWRAEIGPAAVAPATATIRAMSDADDSAALADVLRQLSIPGWMRTMPELTGPAA